MTTVIISAGEISSDQTYTSGDSVTVYGSIENNQFNDASFIISSGGQSISSIISASVASSAFENISSGGNSFNTTLNGYATQVIEKGGVASNTIVNNTNGTQIVYGTNYNATVHGGNLSIQSGGIDISTSVDSFGSQQVLNGAIASATTLLVGGQQYVFSGGVAYETVISNSGYQYISGGITSGTIINSTGRQNVYSGGTAIATTVSSGGLQTAYTNAILSNTTINGGRQNVSSGGIAYETTIISGGRQDISAGATAATTTILTGNQYVYSNASAAQTTISGGSQFVSGGTVSDTIINSTGNQYIYSGGSASNTSVNSGGTQNVYPNAVANQTTVNNAGRQLVTSAIASNTIVNSGGTQTINTGAYASDTTLNGGRQNIYAGSIASNTTVNNGGALHVFTSGTAFNTLINSGGSQFISMGGITSDTTINNGGVQNIVSKGIASTTIISAGGIQNISSGGTANNTTINSNGIQNISSSGVTSTTIINSGAVQNVSSGGTANATTINSNGIQNISAGLASATIINTGAVQNISSGGTANDTTINNGGVQNISSYGSASATIISAGAIQNVSSGGTANGTTINNGGFLLVGSGGKLSGLTTLELGGSATIYPDAGGAINLAGDTNGGLTISGLENGGTVNTILTVISGFTGSESGNSDIIKLAGINKEDVDSVEYKDANDVANENYVTLTLKNASKITLNIIGAQSAGYTLNSALDGSLIYEVCFLTGSMIKTLNGDIAVEDLHIGDQVMTFDWKQNQEVSRSIRWVGSKTVKVNPKLTDDKAGYPVRVLKNAISYGVPYKDLLITSEHCLFLENKFIPARMLVNGRSIYYDYSITDYTYYHIETEDHSVIWADGMLTESYLDTNNRSKFKQHDHFSTLSLHRKPKKWDQDACAPLAINRQEVEPIYCNLAERAKLMKLTSMQNEKIMTHDANLHLITETGLIIQPTSNHNNLYCFILPKEVDVIYISSRTSRPSDTIGPFVDDRRNLGVLVGEIHILTSDQIHDITNHLNQPNLPGWDVLEQTSCRWTNGKALLKIDQKYSGKRILTLHILSAGPYIIDQQSENISLKNIA